MDIYRVAKGFPQDIEESLCPVEGEEGKSFDLGTLIVQCPKCLRWYHLDCWSFVDNKCSILGCPGVGAPSARILDAPQPVIPPLPPAPPAPPQAVDEEIYDRIHILEDEAPEVIILTDPLGEDPSARPISDRITIIKPWEIKMQSFATKSGLDKLVEPLVKSIVHDGENYYTVQAMLVLALSLVIVFTCLFLSFAVLVR